MIEIKSKLVREQTSVFLCGETVECFITFINQPLPEYKFAQSNSDILENLAWATAQIHCYCNSTVKSTSNDQQPAGNMKELVVTSTSLRANQGQPGDFDCVLSTDPKILFCDLRLAPGESKSYLYKEQLPITAPPTYRGIDIKYFYKITISTQRVGSRVQMLNIPIRILPLPIFAADEAPTCDETNEELAPTNPFLENKNKETKLEISLHHLQSITARRRPNFYLISNKRGKVGRFCLFKPAYKLGEDIVGTLDFSSGTVKCIQLSVTLQCQEILKKKTKEVITSPNEKNVGRTIDYTKHHEICIGLLQTQMILPIPLHVTPSFATQLVDVKWRLHFQFVTSTNKNLEVSLNESNLEWHAPDDISIETMIWNLPVTIYPTNPMQITQISDEYSMIIK